MTRLALTLLLLPMAVHAADCKPPNVARAVLVLGKSFDGPLKCPPVGLCYHISDQDEGGSYHGATLGRVDMVCLTPDEERKALER